MKCFAPLGLYSVLALVALREDLSKTQVLNATLQT